jgi:hypothetical protein
MVHMVSEVRISFDCLVEREFQAVFEVPLVIARFRKIGRVRVRVGCTLSAKIKKYVDR